MKTVSALTWGLYNNYGGRKKPGYLSVIVDVEHEIIYPVPLDVEHIEFISKNILNVSKEDVTANPLLAEKLIPSIIEIDDISREVRGVLTGISGVEIGFGVRHSMKDLEKAHAMVLDFIANGEIRMADNFNAKISPKYSKK